MAAAMCMAATSCGHRIISGCLRLLDQRDVADAEIGKGVVDPEGEQALRE
jgi:hypothetical protein